MFVIMNIVGVVYFYLVYCICKCLSFVQFYDEWCKAGYEC